MFATTLETFLYREFAKAGLQQRAFADIGQRFESLRGYQLLPQGRGKNTTALDALLKKDPKDEDLDDLEYQFRVVYTFDSASKGKAHIQFLSPDSAEGKRFKIYFKNSKIADELYRYKPGDLVKIVRKATAKPFAMSDHTTAWQKHKVRPPKDTKPPDKTNRDYCIYHPAHRDYTYNDKWIALLIGERGGANEAVFAAAPEEE